jgi:GT2 family glycosyltransferase
MISIIILNWNAKEMTKECLNSIKNQSFKDYETILVDNASTDGSSEYLKKRFPEINLIKNKENYGYAKGNNIGIKKARGNYILILNNDIVLDKTFLKELDKNKNKADILGTKNYFYDKPKIIWAIGSKLNKFTMRANLVANKLKDSKEIDKMKINHAVGSAMLVNKKVFEKVGYLNENYFAYFEETEFQLRAQEYGFKISWIPSAKLWHKVGFSTGGGRTPLSAYYLTRNRAYCIKQHAKYKIIAYPYWILEVFVRLIYGFLKNRKFAKMSWKGAIGFFKGEKGRSSPNSSN